MTKTLDKPIVAFLVLGVVAWVLIVNWYRHRMHHEVVVQHTETKFVPPKGVDKPPSTPMTDADVIKWYCSTHDVCSKVSYFIVVRDIETYDWCLNADGGFNNHDGTLDICIVAPDFHFH
jgi:hypothetical protein